MNRHQTAGTNAHSFSPYCVQAIFRQQPELADLFEITVFTAGIQTLEQLLEKRLIRCHADEVAAAPQHQRLIDRLLEAIMPLFDIPVLIRLAGLGLFAIDPVMSQ